MTSLVQRLGHELLQAVEQFREELVGAFDPEPLDDGDIARVAGLMSRLDRYGSGWELIEGWWLRRGGGRCMVGSFVATYVEVTAGPAGGGRHEALSVVTAGVFRLPKDVGQMFSRPEGWGDKLAELFRPAEIDFESHPELSRKYYVLATDEERLVNNIQPEVLTHLGAYDGLHAEADGRDLVVDWPETLKPGVATRAGECFAGLAERLPDAAGYR